SRTIWISHGSNFRLGEKTGAVAFAVVLRSDAQDVRKRSYSGETADARARTRLGRHRHGSRSRPQTASLPALYSIGKNTHRGAHRLSLLNRHQFCRGQKSWPERRFVRMFAQSILRRTTIAVGGKIAFENYRARFNRIFKVESDNL